VVNAVGDEKCREHINSVMHMREQDDDSKHKRKENENIAESFVFPKNKSEEERHARVPRKKQITAECQLAQYVGIYRYSRGERPDVSQSDENGSDDNEQGDTFYQKWSLLWPYRGDEK
jgi:hypothetical protein